jgi:hypothetical protein
MRRAPMASKAADNPALLRVLFALLNLPSDLQSAILSDQQLIRQFDIPATPRRLKLSDTATMERNALFAAFQNASVEGTATVGILDGDNVVQATVRVDEEGTGILEAGNLRTQFAHGGLWNADAGKRAQVLTRILGTRTLFSESRRKLSALVNSSQFGPEDFIKGAEILSATPEEFVLQLRRLTEQKSEFHEADFLPENPTHWDNLTAAPTTSQTFRAYLDNELRAERAEKFSSYAMAGFELMSLQFGAQESVPHEWFESLPKHDVLAFADAALNFEDHFCLVGAFEICARNFAADSRLIAAGDRLLDKLFSDRARMLRRCAVFGAVFILSTVRLVMHARTRDRPAYWRRFSAATHASLVVRAFGEAGPSEEIFDWAMKMRQDYYILSVYADMGASPRWQPEWIEPESLAADAYGRAMQILQLVPDSQLPASWAERLMPVGEWIGELGMLRRAFLPSLTQGERLAGPPPLAAELQNHFDDSFRELSESPTPERLLKFANMVELSGAFPNATEQIAKAVQRILTDIGTDVEVSGPVLAVSSRMAVVSRDVRLADLVADHLAQLALASPDNVSVFNSLVRYVECAAADVDAARSREHLARRLENFASLLPVGNASLRLMIALRCLRRTNTALAPNLGRAENIAKLGTAQMAVRDISEFD